MRELQHLPGKKSSCGDIIHELEARWEPSQSSRSPVVIGNRAARTLGSKPPMNPSTSA